MLLVPFVMADVLNASRVLSKEARTATKSLVCTLASHLSKNKDFFICCEVYVPYDRELFHGSLL